MNIFDPMHSPPTRKSVNDYTHGQLIYFYSDEKYHERLNDLRNYLYRKCMQFGENLMPCDVAEIIQKSQKGGKFKRLIFNSGHYFVSIALLAEVYTSCGFCLDDVDYTRNFYFQYF